MSEVTWEPKKHNFARSLRKLHYFRRLHLLEIGNLSISAIKGSSERGARVTWPPKLAFEDIIGRKRKSGRQWLWTSITMLLFFFKNPPLFWICYFLFSWLKQITFHNNCICVFHHRAQFQLLSTKSCAPNINLKYIYGPKKYHICREVGRKWFLRTRKEVERSEWGRGFVTVNCNKVHNSQVLRQKLRIR